MGQSKLVKGVLAGAAIGGVLMLLDKETRGYMGEKSRAAGTKCKGYMTQPSELIHSVRINYEYMSKQLNKGVEDLLEILRKTEEILNKVGEINQEVEKQLKAADKPKEAS
jgi:gas vesicle protein